MIYVEPTIPLRTGQDQRAIPFVDWCSASCSVSVLRGGGLHFSVPVGYKPMILQPQFFYADTELFLIPTLTQGQLRSWALLSSYFELLLGLLFVLFLFLSLA